MQGLHIDVRLNRRFGGLAKYTGRCFKTLVAPLLDLVGMHIEFVRHTTPRLKHHAADARNVHLTNLFEFPEPPLYVEIPFASALQLFQRWLNRSAMISSKATGLSINPFAIANLFNPSTTSGEMVAS